MKAQLVLATHHLVPWLVTSAVIAGLVGAWLTIALARRSDRRAEAEFDRMLSDRLIRPTRMDTR